ncbi:isatin hydrolase-like [Paramacrobiotus metropolitanus]|uniref:isatin hydrolase-like n=1 Tax=Paramacrobiotus metropolitanus TaxID=2943436 RepID=UPI002445F2B9|nr:isatin hydrolase-like [Paramacrobiotus metropolitanus]
MLIVLFALLLCWKISNVQSAPVETEVDFSSDRILDLSYTYDKNTVYWPHGKGYDTFNLTMIAYNEADPDKIFYRAGYYSTGEHGGTHIDTPAHLLRNGTDAENLEIQQLIGPAVVISIAEHIQAGHLDYALSPSDVSQWESQHGRIPDGAFVFLFADWGQRWPDRQRVFNVDDLSDYSHMRFPGFHPDAIQWLITQRDIRGVASDGPSVESSVDIASERMGTHILLAKHNRIGVENVANLHKVPATGATVILMPMKISNATGAPLRLFAVLPEQKE